MIKKFLFLAISAVALLALTVPAYAVNTQGTLVVGVQKDARSLDPIVVGDNASAQMYKQVFNSLVTINKDLEIVPSLATWKTKDSKVWVFTLRKGVNFHNGDPLTVEDVIYTYKTVMNPKTSSPNFENLKIIKSISRVNSRQIKFVLKYQFSAFLERVYTQRIVNKKVREKDPIAYGLKPVGTGPFKVVEWKKNSQILLERNENYWATRPNLKKVILRPIPDPSVALVNLEAGSVDVLMTVLPDDFDRVRKNPNLVLDVKPALNYYFLAFNVENKPVNDIRVRKAIYQAVNMNSIVSSVLGKAGVRAKSSLSPSSWAYNENVEKYALSYNIKRAKKLLKAAGYPNGFEITIYTPQDTFRRKIGEMMQIQLQAVGIKAKVSSLEWASYIPLIDAGKTSMYMMGWNWLTDPDGLIYDIHHSQRKAWASNLNNYNGTRFYNAEVDRALESARKSSNLKERKKAYRKVQEIWFKNYVHIPLYHKVAIVAYNKKVHDFFATPIEDVNLCTPSVNVWVD